MADGRFLFNNFVIYLFVSFSWGLLLSI